MAMLALASRLPETRGSGNGAGPKMPLQRRKPRHTTRGVAQQQAMCLRVAQLVFLTLASRACLQPGRRMEFVINDGGNDWDKPNPW